MHSKKLKMALLGAGLFIAGWAAGQLAGGAPATALPKMDPNMVALMAGVASVAIDAEAAAIRINQVADRLEALERRVVQLEPQGKR